jgi:hypothetical protein
MDSAVDADELHIIAITHLNKGGFGAFALIHPAQPYTVDPVAITKAQRIPEYLPRPELGVRTLAGSQAHEQRKDDHSLSVTGYQQIGQSGPPTSVRQATQNRHSTSISSPQFGQGRVRILAPQKGQ